MNTKTLMNEDLALVEERPAAAPARTAVTVAPQAGPLAMAMQAMQAGMSVADMRAMLDLQKDWEANEARKAYVEAMSAFKRSPPEIFKRKEVAFSGTQYMHATLGDVTEAITRALAEHGISHRWDTVQQGGQIIVTCILTHKLGHSERTTLEGGADDSGKKNRIQQVASTVTYLQRYTLLAATGLATKDIEDDDGTSAGAAVDNTEPSEFAQGWIDYALSMAGDRDKLNAAIREARKAFNAARDIQGLRAFNAKVSAA